MVLDGLGTMGGGSYKEYMELDHFKDLTRAAL
jgi:hypothetical protein